MRRVFWCLCLLVGLSIGFASVGKAQNALIKDFSRWSDLATKTEDALDADDTESTVLEDLRNQVVEFRAEFDAASDLNAARIATLREQIAALGEPPADETSGSEPPDVAAQRADLNEQLSSLLTPVQQAEAQFVRADALVSQIDQSLRERQTQQLLSTAPIPLNPIHWEQAIKDLTASVKTLMQQTPDMQPELQGVDLRTDLPVTIVLGLLGLALIFRGRFWSRMIATSLQRIGGRGFGIWRFLASLLRIVLPFGGLNLLALSAISTGLFGPALNEMFLLFAFLGGIMLAVRWVAERVFSRDDDEALIPLAAGKRREVRFHVTVITVLIILSELIYQILAVDEVAAASRSVLGFPMTVLVAVSLYRIGLILRGYKNAQLAETEEDETRVATMARFVGGLGTGAVVVAIVAPLLAAAGYFRAADALMPPYIMTLVVLGAVMAFQRFAADVYGAITGQGEQARDALMPVLFGLILLAVATPLLALIWGARVTDLTELWSGFLRGFAVGDTRISPTDFLTFAIIFALGYVLTHLLKTALRSNVLPKTQIEIGAQNAIVSGVGYVGIFLAALAAITGAGIDLSSLAIVAGALSVGIGFGLQNIVSNFVSGIILLIERPISEGDWIEVGGQMGHVRDISVRSTRIETFDKTDMIVPNADLVSGTVTNYTRGNTTGRVIVTVGVAYGTDTKKVEEMLREIAEEQPMVMTTPPPTILFVNFGADALEFEVRCFLRDVHFMLVVKSDINHAIAARFAEEGIEIPFAQRDVWLRNPEALRAASDAKNGNDKADEVPT
ncbi:Mechanosensitive ion channel protein [Sulfitobacter noctilucicola]|uniref:Small-conductance mechanosensitive channel n=1 Tax=Sulfitobacter noctilucicola TaxID=1342301 RepID=A0A7W6M7I6_9RHOB|nr:DUF3772 domain-containing protein [Sulfitobacter noctilucicola]KIN64979.1 Mechanosensitive ion channel protein [Sulfitobacter noctilucicola]MBB4173880.1 small-conductance mechanosensitive channel [Sulfitobacter noctilucicola]